MLAVINSTFDAASVNFLFTSLLESAIGAQWAIIASFLMYSLIGASVAFGALVLPLGYAVARASSLASTSTELPQTTLSIEDLVSPSIESQQQQQQQEQQPSVPDDSLSTPVSSSEKELLPFSEDTPSTAVSKETINHGHPSRKSLSLLPTRQWLKDIIREMLTAEYIMNVAFLVVHTLRMQFFFGSIHDQIVELANGDHEQISLYSNILGIVLPLGFITAPLIGWMLDKRGLPISLSVVNTLGLLFSLCNLIPFLPAQVATFALFTCYRAFIFAANAAYIAQIFGFHRLGTFTGTISITASMLSNLSLPMYALVRTASSTFPWIGYPLVNSILALSLVPCFIVPLLLHLKVLKPRPSTTALSPEKNKNHRR